MKKVWYTALAVGIISLFLGSAAPERSKTPDGGTSDASTPTVEELLKRAEEAIANINDYTGTMVKQERFKDGIEKAIMEFKFARPFKVYLKFIQPFPGREGIFIRGWNDNEVKVHKGSFPDITVNLDPQGGTAMEGNHHPITHFGLENTIEISAANLRKAIQRGEGTFKASDGGILFGEPVWMIEATFPQGGHFTIAKEDETLWDIAKRTGQDMYLILYTNQNYDEPDDVDEGDKVFIPRYYGGRAEFCISQRTSLPRKASTWDWSGRLYESYEYPELKLNLGLTKQDFDPKNRDYDF